MLATMMATAVVRPIFWIFEDTLIPGENGILKTF